MPEEVKTAEIIVKEETKAIVEPIEEVGKVAEPDKVEEVEPKEKPKQTPDENAEFARRRRDEERQEALDKRELETAIRITGGINPFTNEKIEDKNDLDEFYLMKQIEKDGGDPLADYAKYLKQKRKEEKEKPKQTGMTEEQAREDWQAFTTAHPEIKLDSLMADKKFLDYADGKIGNKPLAQIYKNYQEFIQPVAKVEKKEETKPPLVKPSPGSLSSNVKTEEEFYTREQLNAFTPQELRKMSDKDWNRVAKSKEYWAKH